MVAASREEGYTHVFGFVDRDFGYSNRDNWLSQEASPVFVPAVHEVENYLIEPAHLANCGYNTKGLGEAQIRKRLRDNAGRRVWWMACRDVLKDLRADIIRDFPTQGKVVADQATAEESILGSPWYANLPALAALIGQSDEIRRRLA